MARLALVALGFIPALPAFAGRPEGQLANGSGKVVHVELLPPDTRLTGETQLVLSVWPGPGSTLRRRTRSFEGSHPGHRILEKGEILNVEASSDEDAPFAFSIRIWEDGYQPGLAGREDPRRCGLVHVQVLGVPGETTLSFASGAGPRDRFVPKMEIPDLAERNKVAFKGFEPRSLDLDSVELAGFTEELEELASKVKAGESAAQGFGLEPKAPEAPSVPPALEPIPVGGGYLFEPADPEAAAAVLEVVMAARPAAGPAAPPQQEAPHSQAGLGACGCVML